MQGAFPGIGDGRGDSVAFFRIPGSGLQHLGEGKLAEPLGEFCPARGGAGDVDWGPTVHGDLFQPLLPQGFGTDSHRGGAAAVEAEQLVLILHPNQGKAVAPNAVGGGLHHGQAGCGGDGGVYGVAARFDDI